MKKYWNFPISKYSCEIYLELLYWLSYDSSNIWWLRRVWKIKKDIENIYKSWIRKKIRRKITNNTQIILKFLAKTMYCVILKFGRMGKPIGPGRVLPAQPTSLKRIRSRSHILRAGGYMMFQICHLRGDMTNFSYRNLEIMCWKDTWLTVIRQMVGKRLNVPWNDHGVTSLSNHNWDVVWNRSSTV